MIGEVFIFSEFFQADMWNINFIPYVGVSIVMKEWVYHSICLSYPYSGNCTNWSGFVMNENIAFLCFWIRLPKVVLNNSFYQSIHRYTMLVLAVERLLLLGHEVGCKVI